MAKASNNEVSLSTSNNTNQKLRLQTTSSAPFKSFFLVQIFMMSQKGDIPLDPQTVCSVAANQKKRKKVLKEGQRQVKMRMN